LLNVFLIAFSFFDICFGLPFLLGLPYSSLSSSYKALFSVCLFSIAFIKSSEDIGTASDVHANDAISLSDVTTIHPGFSEEIMRLMTESAFSPSLE
jgi:hypothetical protein